MEKKLRVLVFAGARGDLSTEGMKTAAVRVGEILAKEGHIYIQGGWDKGFMGLTLEAYRKNGGLCVEVITTEAFKGFLEQCKEFWDELHIAPNLAQRFQMFQDQSDVTIALPGGMGTVSELIYMNETQVAQEHNKPIAVINTDGFYNGLLEQFETMKKCGHSVPQKNRMTFMDNTEKLSEFLSLCKPTELKGASSVSVADLWGDKR